MFERQHIQSFPGGLHTIKDTLDYSHVDE